MLLVICLQVLVAVVYMNRFHTVAIESMLLVICLQLLVSVNNVYVYETDFTQ